MHSFATRDADWTEISVQTGSPDWQSSPVQTGMKPTLGLSGLSRLSRLSGLNAQFYSDLKCKLVRTYKALIS